MSDPFSSTFGAITGAFARNAELAQRQPYSDAQELENVGTRAIQDAQRRNVGLMPGGQSPTPVPGQENRSAMAPGEQGPPAPQDEFAQAVGANIGAVSGEQGRLPPGSGVQPGGPGMQLLQAVGGNGDRQSWANYYERVTRDAMAGGATPQQVRGLIANQESMRVAGVRDGVALAMAARQAGDLQGMANGLNIANRFLPDGYNNQFSVGSNGNLVMTRTPDGGGQGQTVSVSPDQAMNTAMMLMDPKAQQDYLLNVRRFDESVRQFNTNDVYNRDANARGNAAENRAQSRFTGEREMLTQRAALERADALVREAEDNLRNNPNDENTRRLLQDRIRDRNIVYQTFRESQAGAGVGATTAIDSNDRANRNETRAEQEAAAQREMSAARVQLQVTTDAWNRNRNPDTEQAMMTARERYARAESNLTLRDSNGVRAGDRADRNTDSLIEHRDAVQQLRQDRLEEQRLQNGERNAQTEERLRLIRERIASNERIAAARAAARSGMKPEDVEKAATNFENAISGSQRLANNENADMLRMWGPDLLMANPGMSAQAITRALEPYLTGKKPTEEMLRSGVIPAENERGRGVNLPRELADQLLRAGTVDGRPGAQARAVQPAPDSAGQAQRSAVRLRPAPNANGLTPQFDDGLTPQDRETLNTRRARTSAITEAMTPEQLRLFRAQPGARQTSERAAEIRQMDEGAVASQLRRLGYGR